MAKPYHIEMHNILVSKGFKYDRYKYLFTTSADRYYKDDITLIFFEDETITTINKDGMEISIEEFDKLTNGIFISERN